MAYKPNINIDDGFPLMGEGLDKIENYCLYMLMAEREGITPTINQTIHDLNISRTTIWRYRKEKIIDHEYMSHIKEGVFY